MQQFPHGKYSPSNMPHGFEVNISKAWPGWLKLSNQHKQGTWSGWLKVSSQHQQGMWPGWLKVSSAWIVSNGCYCCSEPWGSFSPNLKAPHPQLCNIKGISSWNRGGGEGGSRFAIHQTRWVSIHNSQQGKDSLQAKVKIFRPPNNTFRRMLKYVLVSP